MQDAQLLIAELCTVHWPCVADRIIALTWTRALANACLRVRAGALGRMSVALWRLDGGGARQSERHLEHL